MEIAKNIITGIYFIVCLILIVLILKQSKEDNGASGTVMGAGANNFYEKNNASGMPITAIAITTHMAAQTV